MDTTDRAANIDSKEHGVHKEKRINQYRDQNEYSTKIKRDAGESSKIGSKTLSN
ncbi:hypothetical protein JM84_2278 [Dokdonia sp. Hel_I_63]|uniref:hypothetical protein n=1 Tax=Dokdonia sp. Hel_I_63 TaxID=1249996 RepID=UPI0011996A3E|nr:hypothetical protein [Dokdonia sp. Hel_I_63]TVZ23354.1 hypothetical protein JM84_2278 [Dokdonia sp. Hel_I_63]